MDLYNTSNSPLKEDAIIQIYKNSIYRSIFMSQSFNNLAILTDTDWTFYGSPLPLGTNISQFKADKFNNVWMTSDNGLFVYNPNGVVGIENETSVANNFELFQNYPNPFNPTTKINYELGTTNYITLKVFDLQGKEVRTLVNELQISGSHSLEFNSGDLSSGIYFYTLTSGSFSETKRMVLIK